MMRLTDHHVAGTKRQLKPNTSPYSLAAKAETQQPGAIHMTCGRTWTIEQVSPDQFTDRGGMPRRAMTAIKPDMTHITAPVPKTADELNPNYVATWPDIEAPHTPSASLMK
jgi:hypothetical protein